MIDPWVRPARQQDQENDCVAWAIADACACTSGEGVEMSPRFVLEETLRQSEQLDWAGSFSGLSVRQAMSGLHRIGICREDLCPVGWPAKQQPDPGAYLDAETRLGWWDLKLISAGKVDAALEKANTVVVFSHRIDSSWSGARGDHVFDYPATLTSMHCGFLCRKEPDGTYRYRTCAGPDWCDRGTARVTAALFEHSDEIWSLTYVGPVHNPVSGTL